MRSSTKRNITMSLYGGLISAACTASIALALVKDDLPAVLLSSFLGILPGVVVGALVGLVTDMSERLDAASDTLSDIRSTWLYHKQFIDALGLHKKHQAFTEQLIRLSAVEKIWQIPDVSAENFYGILIDALRHCEHWEGIHHGSIRQLGYERSSDPHSRMAEEYFKALSNAVRKERVEARRILILSEDEERDLNDREVAAAFWAKTGSTVRTFWIREDAVRDKIAKLGDLDDSALHDRELFLQYDRSRQIVRFEADEKMRWVKDMFEKLDLFLDGRPNLLGFVELTQDRLFGPTEAKELPAAPSVPHSGTA